MSGSIFVAACVNAPLVYLELHQRRTDEPTIRLAADSARALSRLWGDW